ncbi:hypothetical protein AAKU55_003920 [Oxalobacteraceae bacterium GrIS 1.11]
MDFGLTDSELAALRALEEASDAPLASAGPPTVPWRLLAFGYVRRDGDGRVILTSNGTRALFQHRCIDALRAIQKDGYMEVNADVSAWLIKCKFVAPSGFVVRHSPTGLSVTRRGLAWLETLGIGPSNEGGGRLDAAAPPPPE